MRKYRVTITMPDGSQGRHSGVYENGFAAIDHALDLFPDALRISAREIA